MNSSSDNPIFFISSELKNPSTAWAAVITLFFKPFTQSLNPLGSGSLFRHNLYSLVTKASIGSAGRGGVGLVTLMFCFALIPDPSFATATIVVVPSPFATIISSLSTVAFFHLN